jgi:hypothetical protein
LPKPWNKVFAEERGAIKPATLTMRRNKYEKDNGWLDGSS